MTSRNTYPEITKEVLLELYIDKKQSSRTIAAQFGCSNNLILKRLRQYDIKARRHAGDPSFSAAERKRKWGRSGELHNLWKGGKTKVTGLIRNRLKHVSDERMKEDSFRCRECTNPSNLHVHHIIPFAEILDQILIENPHISLQNEQGRSEFIQICEGDSRLLDTNNLVTLCDKCHRNEHSDNPVKVVHYDILEKEWRDYVSANHFTMSVSEMGKSLNIRMYRIINYMKENKIPFAYENEDWLADRLKNKSCSFIAKEFNSLQHKCTAKQIREKAYEFGLIDYESHARDVI